MSKVFICGRAQHYRWFVMDSPCCHIPDTVVVSSQPDSVWYAPLNTCSNCGDQWGDGEMVERPFRPRWRLDNIGQATAKFDVACQCDSRIDTEAYAFLPCEHELERQAEHA